MLEVLSQKISTGRSSFFSARKIEFVETEVRVSLIEIISITSSKDDVILALFTRGVHGG